MKYWIGAFAALLLAIPAQSAQAAVLLSGSGWQDDIAPKSGVPTTNSAWTFAVAEASVLSIVDRFIPGDIYTLTGGVAGATTFFAGSAADVQASGPYGSFWLNASYSKLAVRIGPGAYSFSISGNGKGGSPSGLGIRLDPGAVPEPGSWALLVTAFGVVGTMLRRRRSRRVCKVA